MELPNTEKLIERSIYHALRKTVVAYGYIPDVDNYDVTNPDIAIAQAESRRYLDDAKDIKDNKGFTIELFSSGNSQTRGELKVPRIVVETEAFLPGQLGIDTTHSFIPNTQDSFDKMDNSFLSQTSDFYFNIKLINNSIEQQRVLYGLALMTLPRRGYMKWEHEPELLPYSNLFINFLSHHGQEHQQEGITEKTYRYEISDVVELEPTKIKTIPPIISIGDNLDIKVI